MMAKDFHESLPSPSVGEKFITKIRKGEIQL